MPPSPPGAPTLVGFGANYFRNMGPAKRANLNHDADTQINAFVLRPGGGDSPWDENGDALLGVDTTACATVFLTARGKVYTSGTLHGRIETPITRTVIPLPLKCVQISCGRHFGLARMEGGLAVCSWGAGHFGQLGLGHESPHCINEPTVIESLLPHVVGAPIRAVCAGYWHAMVLTEAGEVYSWGCNRNSQCGMRPTKDPPTLTAPQRVRFDLQRNAPKIDKLAAGRSHSVALSDKGAVYCWGSCTFGQCGPVGRRRGGTAPPKQVEALSQVQIVDIAAGDAHTLSLTGGGRVFGWGGGFEGQLGIGSITQLNPKPKLVADLDFVALEANAQFSREKQQQKPSKAGEGGGGGGAATATATATAAETRSSTSAGHNLLTTATKVVSVHASGNSSFATSSAGHVYAWGCNDVGNLGLPKLDPSQLVYAEPGLPLPKGSSIKSGHTHSFDSSHNLALPKRVDCLRDMNITSVSASPTFLWCIGTKRVVAAAAANAKDDEDDDAISKKLQSVTPEESTEEEPKKTPSAKTPPTATRGRASSRKPHRDPPGSLSPCVQRTIDGSRRKFLSGESRSLRNIDRKDDRKPNLETRSNNDSLDNASEGSVEEFKTHHKAKKVFSRKSFKKGVAKFARRASLGAFGNKPSDDGDGGEKRTPKAKRRSFFGSATTY